MEQSFIFEHTLHSAPKLKSKKFQTFRLVRNRRINNTASKGTQRNKKQQFNN